MQYRITAHPRIFLLALAATAAWYATAGAQSVTRGPYLQIVTGNGVVIRWRTDVPTDSRVQYDTTCGTLGFAVEDTTSTTEHVMLLSSLLPNTRYCYAVGSTTTSLEGNDAGYHFRTSPPDNARNPLRIWVIGDSGAGDHKAAGVRNGYMAFTGSTATDVWLTLGDNAYDTGTDAEYQAGVFDMYASLLRNSPVWPSRGNHDQIHPGANNDYYDIFSLPDSGQAGGVASGSEAYYSFDYANVHFICLDSYGSDRSPGGAMLTWLTQDLAATAKDWIVAYWHHAPYTKGSHDSDTEQRLIDMRANALPILESGGVDLVLTGHSHAYERSFLIDSHYGDSSTLADSMVLDDGDGSPTGAGAYVKPLSGPRANQGTVYVVAGTSSKIGGGTLDHPAMIRSYAVLGSFVLDVSGDELTGTFIDTTGTAWDSFAIRREDTPVGTPARKTTPAFGRIRDVGPNPTDAVVRIDYDIARAGDAEIVVFDVSGRRVDLVVRRFHGTGRHVAYWNLVDGRGRRVAQGVYFAVLRSGVETDVRKVVVAR